MADTCAVCLCCCGRFPPGWCTGWLCVHQYRRCRRYRAVSNLGSDTPSTFLCLIWRGVTFIDTCVCHVLRCPYHYPTSLLHWCARAALHLAHARIFYYASSLTDTFCVCTELLAAASVRYRCLAPSSCEVRFMSLLTPSIVCARISQDVIDTHCKGPPPTHPDNIHMPSARSVTGPVTLGAAALAAWCLPPPHTCTPMGVVSCATCGN